jgi:hypothetical protein
MNGLRDIALNEYGVITCHASARGLFFAMSVFEGDILIFGTTFIDIESGTGIKDNICVKWWLPRCCTI